MQAEEHDTGVAAPKLQPAVWQHVSENIYRHRDRRKQHEDDIMICNCHKPRPGQLGCGPNCLNRLLNLECVPVRRLRLDLLCFCGRSAVSVPACSPTILDMTLSATGVLPMRGPVLKPELH